MKNKYSKILKSFLFEFEEKFKNSSDGLETLSIIDEERKHFQSVVQGFKDDRYIFIVQFHFDIKNEQVWIMRNMTDIDLGEELIERGIPKSDIVLGFLPEYERKYSSYGNKKQLDTVEI